MLLVIGLLPCQATATTLNLKLHAHSEDGPSIVTVMTNCEMRYVVTGKLSDWYTGGLSGFGFDLVYDGGSLQPGEVPTTSPTTAFAMPQGINNGWFGSPGATGFGGTPVRGKLRQCGGVMNTLGDGIETVTLPFPTGPVLFQVAETAPQALLRGTLTTPAVPGTYTLAVTAACENLIQPDLSSDQPCEDDSDCSGDEVCRGHPFASAIDQDQSHGGSHFAVSAIPVALAEAVLTMNVVDHGTCSAMPPLPAPYPHDRRKSRYISFDTNNAGNDGQNIAFKVELKEITLGSCEGSGAPCIVGGSCKVCSIDGNPCFNASVDCTATPGQTCDATGAACLNDEPYPGGTNVGLTGWVMEPRDPTCYDLVNEVPLKGYCRYTGPTTACLTGSDCTRICSQTIDHACTVDADCPFGKTCTIDQPCDAVPQCQGADYICRVGIFTEPPTPSYVSRNWPTTVHVSGCEIVPAGVYGVRAFNLDTGAESEELLVETGVWGDAVSNLVHYCNGEPERGRCDGNGAGCAIDQDCPIGQPCIVAMCGNGNDTCDTSADCDSGHLCLVGKCADPGQVCEEGAGNCPSGYACVRANSCLHDEDCPSGETCVSAWGPPDGVANFTDVQAVVFCFSDAAGSTLPHMTWVDLHGRTDITEAGTHIHQPPNYVCNFTDILQVILAFQGRPYWFNDPANCGESLLGLATASTGSPTFTLDVSDYLVNVGEELHVDVFITEAINVSAFEVAMRATGGTAGTLNLTNITIDEARTDYVFLGQPTISGTDLQGIRAGAALASTGSGITESGPLYLASFTFEPSGDANGQYRIALQDSSHTFLLEPDGTTQLTLTDEDASVWAGVECITDADCEFSGPCVVSSTCVSNSCQYTYAPAGTSCNDGLWCTRNDTTCNASGECTGGTPRCDPGFTCDEIAHLCFGEAP